MGRNSFRTIPNVSEMYFAMLPTARKNFDSTNSTRREKSAMKPSVSQSTIQHNSQRADSKKEVFALREPEYIQTGDRTYNCD